MAVDYGAAFAQGLAQGVGEGIQDYYKDQRRERADNRRMAKSFDMYRKNAQLSFGLQEVAKKNAQLDEWEKAAKLSADDLAFQVANKVAEPYSKEDRPQVFRDTYKNLNNMPHPELMVRAGYVRPDYSDYIDNPDYQDVIPTSRIAGISELPNAAQVFKYDQRKYESTIKKAGDKLTDYDKKVATAKQGLRSMTPAAFNGAILSEKGADVLYSLLGSSGFDVQQQGGDIANSAIPILNGQLMSPDGSLVLHGNTIIPREGLPEETEITPLVEPASPIVGTDTAKTAYLAEQEEKEDKKVRYQAAQHISDKYGNDFASYETLQELRDSAEAVKDNPYLYGDVSWKGLGTVSKTVIQAAAKAGDAEAKEALAFLSKFENISAALKHEQFGSAQTNTELASFDRQLKEPGLLQNNDTLITQINERMKGIGAGIRGKVGVQDRQYYMDEHPDASYAQGIFGTKEPSEALEGTKETVSDSSEAQEKPTMEGVVAHVDSLIASGKLDASQRSSAISHLTSKFGLTMGISR